MWAFSTLFHFLERRFVLSRFSLFVSTYLAPSSKVNVRPPPVILRVVQAFWCVCSCTAVFDLSTQVCQLQGLRCGLFSFFPSRLCCCRHLMYEGVTSTSICILLWSLPRCSSMLLHLSCSPAVATARSEDVSSYRIPASRRSLKVVMKYVMVG